MIEIWAVFLVTNQNSTGPGGRTQKVLRIWDKVRKGDKRPWGQKDRAMRTDLQGLDLQSWLIKVKITKSIHLDENLKVGDSGHPLSMGENSCLPNSGGTYGLMKVWELGGGWALDHGGPLFPMEAGESVRSHQTHPSCPLYSLKQYCKSVCNLSAAPYAPSQERSLESLSIRKEIASRLGQKDRKVQASTLGTWKDPDLK